MPIYLMNYERRKKMASVSKLKKMLDELRYKYQEKKRELDIIEKDSLVNEILEDLQEIDLYCHDRNRY